jgi:hypothetical protein
MDSGTGQAVDTDAAMPWTGDSIPPLRPEMGLPELPAINGTPFLQWTRSVSTNELLCDAA